MDLVVRKPVSLKRSRHGDALDVNVVPNSGH